MKSSLATFPFLNHVSERHLNRPAPRSRTCSSAFYSTRRTAVHFMSGLGLILREPPQNCEGGWRLPSAGGSDGVCFPFALVKDLL